MPIHGLDLKCRVPSESMLWRYETLAAVGEFGRDSGSRSAFLARRRSRYSQNPRRHHLSLPAAPLSVSGTFATECREDTAVR